MTAMQGALSAAERSMRSVFVGNIPYEATEEQLKDIFSEVGPVVSFRLVYDRETGKPKGYGFCEYKDQEMALSAMRNLNGYELNGRALRVDNAASEKSKEELKNLQASLGGPPVESPFGAEVSPDKAPEIVSKVIASLPPEQLYELMTQMKMCIENNPNEARTLLIQNPQLGYALLQAQVIMKIVEPEVALAMIHKNGPSLPAGLLPTPAANQAPVTNAPMRELAPPMNEVPNSFPPAAPPGPIQNNPVPNAQRAAPMVPPSRPSLLGDRPPAMPAPPAPPMGNPFPDRAEPIMGDHDLRAPPMIDHDMRPPPMMPSDRDMRQVMSDQDFRGPPGMQENRPPYADPRYRNAPGPGPEMIPPNQRSPYDKGRPGPAPDARAGYDGRGPIGMSPRMDLNMPPAANPVPGRGPPVRNYQNPRMAPPPNTGSPLISAASPNAVSSPRPGNPLAAAAAAIAPHDQEKAALIMQVLQLTDQQISMLPPEQRQSIMVLKEQIARSQQAT